MLEYIYGKRFGLKIAWANRKEGSGGFDYRNRLWRVMTHMEATGRCVKEIGRMSHGSSRWAPYLIHIPAHGLHVGCYPPQPVSVLEPSTTLSPTFLFWLRLFLSQTFSRINTPAFSNLVILHIYPPMKMEQTQCSETSAYEIQMPGNYPEESMQHSEHGERLKSRIESEMLQSHYAAQNQKRVSCQYCGHFLTDCYVYID